MAPRGKKWKQEDIINAFKQRHGDTYDYSRVVYVGSDVNVWIGCKKHPNSSRADKNGIVWFQQTPHHHLAGEGCPLCNESHTERLLANWLINAQINFERYQSFEWLPKGCHVDFYLSDYGVAIEYQGEMHYLPKFGINELEKQQKRDSVKRELCKQHNIPLYEITYTDDVLEKIQEIINKIKDNSDNITESKTNKNMKQNVIKLNESTLRQIVAESVKKMLKEWEYMSYEDTDAYREEENERREEQHRQTILKNACDELISVFYDYGATDEDCNYYLKYIGDRVKIHDSALVFNGADR